MSLVVNRLLIIGIGLIAGSMAKAAKERGLCSQVIGVSRRRQTLDKALAAGVVDQVYENLADIAPQLTAGDMVVIGVPPLTVPAIIEQLQPLLDAEVTVTDVASVKGSVVDAVKQTYGQVPPQFVPGHPIAGSEKSGVDAVNERLFEDHRVILTPLTETGTDHLQRVRELWQGLGVVISEMPVHEHDEVLAATSHLPHLLAYSLVDTLASMEDNREIFRYAAGGFRDFTRIASSDPLMWHDIVKANGDALLTVLEKMAANVGQLQRAIKEKDSEYLLGVFTRASEARKHFAVMLDNKAYLEADTEKMINYRALPGGSLQGEVRVPGDKSISHRAIMLGSLAEGITEVTGFLEGEDSLATLQAFRDMGVVIEGPDAGRLVIHGVGLHGLKAPANPLYLGNSGTSMRLLSGLLAGQPFDVELTGDESLSKRPMARVAKPLRQMGAQIETNEGGRPPLCIKGGQTLRGIDYELPMASAQVKSCVLLAGLYAEGETRTHEPAPTRDHTERMLSGFGYAVTRGDAWASLKGGDKLTANNIDVPADISSATFFMVAAAIAPGSDITLVHVGINPTRVGAINILQMMGADIQLGNVQEVGGESVADIRVRYAPLHGIRIPEEQVPLAIDEFPAIFVAAACAEGQTVLTGAEELRVKESDRIQAMADGLQQLGISAKPTEDGIVIQGGEIGSGEVDSCDDHRIAMSFAVASLRASGPVKINNCNNVATSFPGFVTLANKAGMNLHEDKGLAELTVSEDSSAHVIAVDGPSGSGKGTISQMLAARLGYHYLDSGALYRLLSLAASRQGVSLDDCESLVMLAASMDIKFQMHEDGTPSTVLLNGEDVSEQIRNEAVGADASIVAAYEEVRQALMKRQRAFAKAPGLVADGRDMGTVVFPHARHKIFLTASPEVRAIRRYNQLIDKGENVSLAALVEQIRERDERDSTRAVSPLAPAEDAVVLDGSGLSIQEVLDRALQVVSKNTPARAEK